MDENQVKSIAKIRGLSLNGNCRSHVLENYSRLLESRMNNLLQFIDVEQVHRKRSKNLTEMQYKKVSIRLRNALSESRFLVEENNEKVLVPHGYIFE